MRALWSEDRVNECREGYDEEGSENEINDGLEELHVENCWGVT